MGSAIALNPSPPRGVWNTKPVPHLEFWGRFVPSRPQRMGRAFTGWGTGRASDVPGFAFGCLVADGFGPLGPVLDLAREQIVQDLAFVFLSEFRGKCDSPGRATHDRAIESQRAQSGCHDRKDPGIEFLSLGFGLT